MYFSKNSVYAGKRASVLAAVLIVACALVVSGCISNRPMDDVITVTGTVTVRGNEPFTAVILETDDRNLYVLNMTRALRTALETPARMRVIGRLYLGDWNGRAFAHLDVQDMSDVAADPT